MKVRALRVCQAQDVRGVLVAQQLEAFKSESRVMNGEVD